MRQSRHDGQTLAKNVLDLKLVGRVAQVVEQRPFKAWVAGSNPAALTNPLSSGFFQWTQKSLPFPLHDYDTLQRPTV